MYLRRSSELDSDGYHFSVLRCLIMYSDNRWEEYLETKSIRVIHGPETVERQGFLLHNIRVVFKYGYNAGYVEVFDKERNVLMRSLPTL